METKHSLSSVSECMDYKSNVWEREGECEPCQECCECVVYVHANVMRSGSRLLCMQCVVVHVHVNVMCLRSRGVGRYS